jgi:hypothetical protein
VIDENKEKLTTPNELKQWKRRGKPYAWKEVE